MIDHLKKCPIWLIVAMVAPMVMLLAASWDDGAYTLEHDLWLCRLSGYAAVALLSVTLAITPLKRILSYCRGKKSGPLFNRIRRQAGISSFCLAIVHAWTAWTTFVPESWTAIWRLNYLRTGILALAVLAILFATSFNWVVRLLRLKVWSEVHRLFYVAAVLAVLHLVAFRHRCRSAM